MRRMHLLGAIICIVCISLCLTSVPVYASEKERKQERKSMVEVIKDQKTLKEDEDFFDTERYDASLKDYDFSNDAILKVYYRSIWEYAEKEVEEVVEKVEKNNRFPGYVVLQEKPILIGDTMEKGKSKIGIVEQYDTCPTYLRDIMESAVHNSKLVTMENEFSKVVCFDDTRSHGEIVVYYVGDKETLVYVYETYTASPLEFTLQEFQEYGEAYHEYLISDELNYDENGKFLYGGRESFTKFVGNEDLQDYINRDATTQTSYPIFIGAAVMVALLACVCVIKICQKKAI